LYKAVDTRVSFPKMEESILSFWETNQIFQKSIDQRAGSEEFIFFDGPPFATGLPHFGHFVPGTIKDIIPRYQAMKGRKVQRRFGWDCHGLPVEYEMEKELGISGKSQIEEYGVAEFNEACRGIVLRYTGEWETTMTRMGRWVDFRNDYKTMDPDYMESIWWVFKQLWEKGLIYEGAYILPYSPKLATPLSNFEVNLGGYKDVHDPAITIRFTVTADGQGKKDKAIEAGKLSFLAWTTTPWTLPSNLGLALGEDIDYVRISDNGEEFILAESRLPHYYKDEATYKVIGRMKGKDLAGWSYEPLFPYFEELHRDGGFKTHLGDFVTTDDGTGIVHIAPGFGEDDYRTLKHSGLPVLVPIDAECRFTDEIPEYAGLFVKDADRPIINALKENGKLVRRENYLHSYPHCYRTKAPLIYRAISSWFVDIDKIKQIMIDSNDTINWIPGHLQKGRFGKWLENAREWAISRNRFWGNPIPVWKCEECGETVCIGSRDELNEKSGVMVDDLHKHFVDEVSWTCSCGKGEFKRVPEVLDCWFESGAMPYAQNHYPFENKETFEANYPADFIAEGLDQTRGWFYTLTVLAAALFEKPAFQNVVVNGLVLAEDGRKMSKSERNYSDPVEIINTYGADALRLFLMDSAVVKAEDLKYSDNGVKEVLKSVIIPLWNAYSFFVTYANIDQVQPESAPANPTNPLDRWILSSLETLVEEVTANLDGYDLQKAVDPVVKFIDQLNNWYIRRSRRRFWKSENDDDKLEAYGTLYEVLIKLVKVAAPFVPFITEEIYQNLKTDGMSESVHLCDFPEVQTGRRDAELEHKMALTQQAVSMGRAIRSMHNLKVRQPLNAIHLVTRDRDEKNILIEMEDIIREELNVKEVIFRDNEEDLVEYSAKANFRELGRKLGKDMKEAAAAIAKFSGSEIQSLLDGNTLSLDVAGDSIDLTIDSIIVQREEKEGLKVLNEGSLTVALDPVVTEELRQEGLVRDLVRGIQNMRKDSGLQVTDRINLVINAAGELAESIGNFEDYVKAEVLCDNLEISSEVQAAELESGEAKVSLTLSVVD
jgi:isoleucyl-tRNA synthetase